MKLFAVTMVKDEADFIEYSIRHMLTHVDSLIVADNMSTDGTLEILARLWLEFPERMLVEIDKEVGYYQASKMSRLIDMAIDRGADWVIPFDADELWVAESGEFRDAFKNDAEALRIPVRDHGPLPPTPSKVAVRGIEGIRVTQGNHGATLRGLPARTIESSLVIHHFPYRSQEQYERKIRNGVAAYAATNLPSKLGSHWKQYAERLNESVGV